MDLLITVVTFTVPAAAFFEIVYRVAGTVRRLENTQQTKDSAQNARVDNLEGKMEVMQGILNELVAKSD